MSLLPLVVRFGALGDMVLLTPMLRALARSWGGPCDVVTGQAATRTLYAGLPFVGDVRVVPSRKTPYLVSREQRELVRWLRDRPSSPAWLFETVDSAVDKVGWLLARGGVARETTVTVRDLPRDGLEHQVDYTLRMACHRFPGLAPSHDLSAADIDSRPQLTVTDDELAEARAWLSHRGIADRPVVLVQTLSRRANRGRWPRERWVAAIRALLERLPRAAVLLTGVPREAPEAQALADACADPRVAEAATDLPLRRLLAVMATAHSCVSLDSGPAHMAAATGCPVVVLLGVADPRRNRPIGRPGQVQLVAAEPEQRWPESPDGWASWHHLEAIPPEAVVDAWSALEAREESSPAD